MSMSKTHALAPRWQRGALGALTLAALLAAAPLAQADDCD